MKLMESYNNVIDKFDHRMKSYPWSNKGFYGNWLAQSHYFVSHSTRLLTMAAGFSPIDKEAMHRRFIEHCAEEDRHEVLAEQDLKRLGYDLSDFPEFPETTVFYQNQYFVIQNHGSSAFMGWVLFLEGMSSKTLPHIMNLVNVYSSKCTNFMRVHAEEDENHIKSALDMAASLPLEKHHNIIRNIEISHSMYENILNNCELQAKAMSNVA